MKRLFRRLFRSILALIVLFLLFILFILHPQALYAGKRQYKNVTIYSATHYSTAFNDVIDHALTLIRQSELYDSSFHFDVFINDGSSFPRVLKAILGDAFAWGYHHNVVLAGQNDDSLQFIKLNGHYRQLSRTVAHEMIHCLQANRFGIFGSRPVKNIPQWKWEGYPEYVSYLSTKHPEDSILLQNLPLLDSLKNETHYPVEIETDEGKSFAGLDYFRWWLMIKYCVDIKGMHFTDIMEEEVQFNTIYDEMMNWYWNDQGALSPPGGP